MIPPGYPAPSAIGPPWSGSLWPPWPYYASATIAHAGYRAPDLTPLLLWGQGLVLLS